MYVARPKRTSKSLWNNAGAPRGYGQNQYGPGTNDIKKFQRSQKEVDRVLELANNREKVCIGTGCLPFETEPEAVLKTKEYILSKTSNTGE